MKQVELTGVRQLIALGLRRDRLMIPVWVYAIAISVISTAYSYRGLYKTPADRLEFANGVRTNASTLALYGHVYASSTVGGLTAWRLVGIGGAFASVLSVLLVVRHTRADEESGRAELLGSLAIGRHAPLAAAVLIAIQTQLGLAVLTVIGLVACGQPTAGAFAFGLAWLTVATFFASLAAVAAQLAQSARTANTLAMSALGAAYLLRAIGDAGPSLGQLAVADRLGPAGAPLRPEPLVGARAARRGERDRARCRIGPGRRAATWAAGCFPSAQARLRASAG